MTPAMLTRWAVGAVDNYPVEVNVDIYTDQYISNSEGLQ